ncbi:hypothetical protein BDA99DRAFT_431771 [Phascolomyces articulosus]|uniref:Transcription initiation factor IIE subunit alpha N-terminal domain-containing protein n=1 Tax=Phascolomyces articulosus TaxID=60185 RepID=A0AAD5K8P4_9FUNG|nr:hypothetical protein BDA99DRAFT_431771 [Phascolomyces articulosus]
MEARKQDQRPVPKTYYYLDYKEFVDVVKWKMYKMQTNVRDNLRTESENKGYICPNCNRQYLPLEAVSLMDMSDGLFHCDVCASVLEENDNAESVQGSQKELTRLREQSQPIISLLKQTDSLTIPANYIFKPTGTAARNHGARDDHELAIARDTGAGQGEIIVDLQMDNEAARRAKLEEAEEKRQQNALPVWHQRSTVQDSLAGTGDRPKDTEKKEEKESFDETATEEFDADRHDYYAKYYESLSAAAPTGGMDGMDEDEDEEFETVGEGTDYYSPDVNGDDEDIPLVSVNGKMVPLNEVMEEDQRNMSTEEYKAYYEAWQTWQAS